MLHGRFARFNSPHVRCARPAVQQSGKLVQLLSGTGGVDLNTAIIFVPHPAAKAYPARMFLDEPAETHALHAA